MVGHLHLEVLLWGHKLALFLPHLLLLNKILGRHLIMHYVVFLQLHDSFILGLHYLGLLLQELVDHAHNFIFGLLALLLSFEYMLLYSGLPAKVSFEVKSVGLFIFELSL